MPKKITYEDAVDKLETIVAQLEASDTPIETAVKLYKEGIELATLCNEKITTIEGQVLVLKKEADGVFRKESFQYE